MSGSPRHAVAVLSGYNTRAVIAFCRWAAAHEVPFFLIARDATDPILLTDYKDRVLTVRQDSRLSVEVFQSWIETIRARDKFDRVLILPTTEFLNRFLLRNRTELEGSGCTIPLTEEHLYLSISDKESFTDTCRSFGLDVPHQYDRRPSAFPFVAKPSRYSTEDGRQLAPHLILSQSDLDHFLDTESVGDFFFQEYVSGRSIYLLAYRTRSGDVSTYSQENLMQQAAGKSIVLAERSKFHQSEMAEKFVRMLQKTGFFGLIMIELRCSQELERCYVIEANPRLWGPIQLIVDNNIDFFRLMLEDHGLGIAVDRSPISGKGDYYFWSGGLTSAASPIAYHNFSEDLFHSLRDKIAKFDLYRRPDTYDLYQQESEARGSYDT